MTHVTDINARTKARNLYWSGETIAAIADALDLKYGTLDSWKRRDKWDDATVSERTQAQIETRLAHLLGKPDKTDRDFLEIDKLFDWSTKAAKLARYEQDGRDSTLNPNLDKRAEGRKKKAKGKNTFTDEQIEALREDFEKSLFKYQNCWYTAKTLYRVRNVLKSRQIGATWYFAREAFMDALDTGDNQIFLSASKAQAHIFKGYILQWVSEVTGVELKGDPIVIGNNGATIYFLGTNSKTAQGYHGHVYLDEYAWIGRFEEFRKVASAMATHKKWRQTYFSTPSTINHESYAFWSGEKWNKSRAKTNRREFDVSHAGLCDGAQGPDRAWRHMVTIEDAEAQGCDLFDIEALRDEYNEYDFANLFLCQWVDDTQSYFGYDELQLCMVDSWVKWDKDFDPIGNPDRPFGNRKVWIGYDPAKSGDNASVVVIAPPQREGGKYRILEKLYVSGTDFQEQGAAIEALTKKYNVVHIGMDCTGIGEGPFQIVQSFFPGVVGIHYDNNIKVGMVAKAKQLISKKRIEWDAGWTDLSMAFMQIRKTSTGGGKITFVAGRSKEAGHADIAWAVMNALDKIDYIHFDETTAESSGAGGILEII